MAVRRNKRKRGGIPEVPGSLVLACTVLIAIYTFQYTPQKNVTDAPVQTVAAYDSVQLPVPVYPVTAGTRVKDILFNQVPFPGHQVPKGAIADIGQFSEAITLVSLPARLPIFEENLSLKGGTVNPVIERIPAGMRAMTVRVDATAAVEGWAGSGAVVDVLLVEKDQTTVIAEKVRVLSAERSVAPVEGASAPKPPSTVTLLVTQEQCLAINAAIPRGKIAFALRNSVDDESWSRTVFRADFLRDRSSARDGVSGVSGYIEVHGEEEGGRSFALSGGKWIPAARVPDGFLVGKEMSHASN